MINVEVTRENNESGSSLVRRFGKKIGASGLITAAKKRQFRERTPSSFKQKRFALKRLARREQYARLRKLGEV